MKKIIRLMMFLLAGTVMISACSDDDDAEPDLVAPRILEFEVNGQGGQNSGIHSLGDSIHFKFDARADEGLDEYIVREILSGGGGTEVVANEELSGNIQTVEYTYTITNENVSQLEFEVRDQEGQRVTRTYSITVVGIRESQAVLLGAQNAAEGSSYDADNDEVYTLTPAGENSEKIDIMYYHGATNFATLIAPDDETAPVMFSSVANWAVRNETRFKMANAVDFATVTTATQIIDIWGEGSTSSMVNNLEVGNVIAFKTVSGKHGLLLVSDITDPSGSGSIVLDVKIQD